MVKKFLKDHPKEFVCLNLVEVTDHKLSQFQNNFLKEAVLSIFSEFMIQSQDIEEWFSVENVTMGEIWARNKRILITFSNSTIPNQGYSHWLNLAPKSQRNMEQQQKHFSVVPGERLGLFEKKMFFNDRKEGNTEVGKMLEWNNRVIRQTGGDERKFLINRLNVSKKMDEGGGLVKKMKVLFKNKLVSIKKLTKGLKKGDLLLKYVMGHIEKRDANICKIFLFFIENVG